MHLIQALSTWSATDSPTCWELQAPVFHSDDPYPGLLGVASKIQLRSCMDQPNWAQCTTHPGKTVGTVGNPSLGRLYTQAKTLCLWWLFSRSVQQLHKYQKNIQATITSYIKGTQGLFQHPWYFCYYEAISHTNCSKEELFFSQCLTFLKSDHINCWGPSVFVLFCHKWFLDLEVSHPSTICIGQW